MQMRIAILLLACPGWEAFAFVPSMLNAQMLCALRWVREVWKVKPSHGCDRDQIALRACSEFEDGKAFSTPTSIWRGRMKPFLQIETRRWNLEVLSLSNNMSSATLTSLVYHEAFYLDLTAPTIPTLSIVAYFATVSPSSNDAVSFIDMWTAFHRQVSSGIAIIRSIQPCKLK